MEIRDSEFFLVEIDRIDSSHKDRTVVVRLVTNRGLEGWGESAVGWRAGEVAAWRQALLPVLAGRDVFDVEETTQLEALGPPGLRSAVEMALWDLIARALDQPLCNLLGGAYRRRIPTAVRLPVLEADQVADAAHSLAEQGFHSQILNSCGRLEDDLRIWRTVRQAVGRRTEVRLDLAEQFDSDTARDLCAELEADSPQFVLDPLAEGGLPAQAALARQTTVPLGAWRPIRSPADLLQAVRCGAVSWAVVDVDRVGGILAARKCAAVAEAGSIPVLLAGGPSLGIAAAALLQVAAATPAIGGLLECSALQLRDHLLAESLEATESTIPVPQGPGLGVEVDRAKVEHYQVA